jgi:hypothetical protein
LEKKSAAAVVVAAVVDAVDQAAQAEDDAENQT